MILVTPKLFPQFCYNTLNIQLSEICITQVNDLPIKELVTTISLKIKTWKRNKNHDRIWLYLNLNCSPSSSASLGVISNMPEKGYGWPPYAYSEDWNQISFKYDKYWFKSCSEGKLYLFHKFQFLNEILLFQAKKYNHWSNTVIMRYKTYS